MAIAPEVIALGGDVSDAGADIYAMERPYQAVVRVTGDAPILFHRWQSESVDAKAAAPKGSRAKKTDDIASYVWRNEEGNLCLPGEYLRCSLVDPKNGAAKYQQDPRSPRKSALDLFRAGVVALTELAPITRADGGVAGHWEYIDRRRVRVSQAGITRERPALNAGWSAEVVLMVLLPQYIGESLLLRTLVDAGRLVGVADFRPVFGRFSVTHFEVLTD
jgi:hypothetical protein